jgi:protein phosphatase 1 regulatory subunit 7
MYEPLTVGEARFQLMGPPALPQSIFIESHRIDACMEYAARNGLAGIAISALAGFKLPDLSFLLRFPAVEHLTILDAEMLDISAIASLKRLNYLKINGIPKQSIDLSSFPVLRDLNIRWWPKVTFGKSMTCLRVLWLSHYSPPTGDLMALPGIPQLEELNLIQSRKLVLTGIDRFSLLKKLGIYYLAGVKDISPLSAFGGGILEWLEFGNCPKITNHDEVRIIRSLKRLAFNHCGEIPSLTFLNELTALESFSFVGTNIIDGDLTPCLRLKFAGFLNKRHYSHRSEEFPPAGSSPLSL